jgi:hypothetical protein
MVLSQVEFSDACKGSMALSGRSCLRRKREALPIVGDGICTKQSW